MDLSKAEVERYSRHLIMPEVAMEGQKKLKAAKVLVVGTGGLGAPSSLYFAAAGVGTIGLVDFDAVDDSNLQRQVLFSTRALGRPKVEAAKERLLGLNPHIEIRTHNTALSSANALEILKDYDIVVDGTDNFPTRYLVNDACVLLGKPNVYASIFRFEGQVAVFWAAKGPCYRCLYSEPPPPGLVPSCAEGGVLGVLPGSVGTLQATEAIKLILGIGEPLIGSLLLYDALSMTFRKLKLDKDPNCPVCGKNPTVTKLIDYQVFCGMPAVEAPRQEMKGQVPAITVTELKARLDGGEPVVLIDVREPHEWDICRIPGAKLIPLGEVPDRLGELRREDEILVHCRSGVRSAKAVAILKERGFDKAANVSGGILAWAKEIDPSMPTY